jgi:hypothetical protein
LLGARALFLGGVFLSIVVVFFSPNDDPDFWWHVATGRWILEHHGLPAHDLYTFTVAPHRWTDHEYLTEVLLWSLYRAGGLALVSAALAALTWLGFLLLFRAGGGLRRPYVVSGLAIALGAVAGAPIFGPRAQMITFFFSCVEVLMLRSYLRGSSRAINFFPLVMVAWANLHGGWAIAFVFLGVALIAEAIRWMAEGRGVEPARHLRHLGLVALGTAAAVALTPHGLSLYLYPLQTQASAAQQRLITEWFSPDFHQVFLRPFEAMVFLVVLALVVRGRSGRLWIHDALLVIATLALALQSIRHVALFVAATTPILIECGSESWRHVARRIPWHARATRPSRLIPWVTAVALAVIAFAVGVRVQSESARQPQALKQAFPIAAGDWLAAHPGTGTRMYNLYAWGGYLAYRFYPDPNRRVFIFGEAALMGDELLDEYADVETLTARAPAVLDRYGVDYVVFPSGSSLALYLEQNPGWSEAYTDGQAAIFVRKPAAG